MDCFLCKPTVLYCTILYYTKRGTTGTTGVPPPHRGEEGREGGPFLIMPIGKDKVRPNWPIDITTEELFRQFVVRKHGIYANGMLGHESNRALLAYMHVSLKPREAHAHVKTEYRGLAKTNRKAQELFEKILSHLVTNDGITLQPNSKIGHQKLKGAISAIEQVRDKRSIDSFLLLLEAGGLIKNSDPHYKIYTVTGQGLLGA